MPTPRVAYDDTRLDQGVPDIVWQLCDVLTAHFAQAYNTNEALVVQTAMTHLVTRMAPILNVDDKVLKKDLVWYQAIKEWRADIYRLCRTLTTYSEIQYSFDADWLAINCLDLGQRAGKLLFAVSETKRNQGSINEDEEVDAIEMDQQSLVDFIEQRLGTSTFWQRLHDQFQTDFQSLVKAAEPWSLLHVE